MLAFINRKFSGLICKLRSWRYTLKVTEGRGKIILYDPSIRLNITKSPGAKFVLNGNLIISPHLRGITPINIILEANATLIIDGDFTIGQGIAISVSKGAEVYIGGKDKESAAGITADTTIMAYHKIHIGKDFLCAWDIFISDSDWHHIDGQSHHADVFIADHVWIAHKTSILKGTTIGEGSIVASHSKLINKTFGSNALVGGTPAKELKSPVNWCRDIAV